MGIRIIHPSRNINYSQSLPFQKGDTMGKKAKIKHIVKRVHSLYKATDRAIEEAKNLYHSPCSTGCDHCCYQVVSACIPEAVVALRSIWENPTLKDGFSSKLPRLKREVDLLRKPDASNGKWFVMHIPCVFLADHECTIYEDRPLMCRTQMSAEETSDKCKNVGYAQKLKLVDKKSMLMGMISTSLELGQKFGISWGFRPFQLALLDAWDLYVTGVKYDNSLSNADEITEMYKWSQLETRP